MRVKPLGHSRSSHRRGDAELVLSTKSGDDGNESSILEPDTSCGHPLVLGVSVDVGGGGG
jgi:hypothetical protein